MRARDGGGVETGETAVKQQQKEKESKKSRTIIADDLRRRLLGKQVGQMGGDGSSSCVKSLLTKLYW